MKSSPEQFCLSILSKNFPLGKALVNLAMALSSGGRQADSATDLSLRPCYHYQYSSIGKSISGIGDDLAGFESLLSELLGEYFPEAGPFRFRLLNTDISPLVRPHAHCLEDRRYVYSASHKVGNNRPIAIGQELSAVGLNMSSVGWQSCDPPWNLPLSMSLIPFGQNKNAFTAGQINALLDNGGLPLGRELTVNALDSNYSSPEYIADTYRQPNLVNIIRIAGNRNVWGSMSPGQSLAHRQSNSDQRGAGKVYGDKYRLSQILDWDLPCHAQSEFGIRLKNGKECIVQAQAWEGMKIRSKRGRCMKGKTFRLCCIRLLDAQTGDVLFGRPLLLGIWGERAGELTLEEIFWAYRARFDIEHFFRFGKQNLLLDSFQTPDLKHQEAWLKVVQIAYWILWLASPQAEPKGKKWQQYAHKNTPAYLSAVPSPSQVQQQAEIIISGFEKEPFLPKLKIKGIGRKKGCTQTKRIRHPVRRKPEKGVKT